MCLEKLLTRLMGGNFVMHKTESTTTVAFCFFFLQRVCILDMDMKSAEDACKKLNLEYKRDCCCCKKVDVTNCDQLESALNECCKSMKSLDILINNAGVMNDNKWEMEIAINLNAVVRGTMLGMKMMGRDMGGHGGVIVNIASILGMQAIAGCPVYVGTKHAVLGMSRAWGMPFHYNRTGVKVLTMCPGVTDTPLISEAHGLQMTGAIGKECQRELDSMPKQT